MPVSWTNYIGVSNMCAVLSHNAGGYSFYKHAEHGRVTRFRANGVPLDRPGHYVYVRDDEDWRFLVDLLAAGGQAPRPGQVRVPPRPLYSKYRCDYKGIEAEQTIFITREDDVELWDVRVKNTERQDARSSASSATSSSPSTTSRSTTRTCR